VLYKVAAKVMPCGSRRRKKGEKKDISSTN
jgi:hypothetical protein